MKNLEYLGAAFAMGISVPLFMQGCAEPVTEIPRTVMAGVGTGGQAFPDMVDGFNSTLNADGGITKLDFFAATAPPSGRLGSSKEDAEQEAKWRYLYAKEMLRERAKH